jgi:hypothetical protein
MPIISDYRSTITSWFSALQRVLIEKTVVRITQSGPQRLSFKTGRWQSLRTSASTRRPIQLIAREFVQEFSKVYPVVERKALQQVLTTEYADSTVFHWIGEPTGNQRRVISYVVQMPAHSRALHSGFWLPESVLLAMSNPGVLLNVQGEGAHYFTLCWQNQVLSQLRSAICNVPERFAMVQGIPADLPSTTLDADEIPATLVTGMVNFSFKRWLDFFKWQQGSVVQLPLKSLFIAAVSTWVLYLALSSFLIERQIAERQQKISVMGPKVEQLLSLQSDYNSLHEQAELVAGRMQSPIHPSHYWTVYLQLLLHEVTVERFQLKGERLEITAKAKRATDALDVLKVLPFVHKTKFTNATRRVSEFEQFTLELYLTPQDSANER